MKITIKMFSRPISLDVDEDQTINDVKIKLKQLEKIEIEQQRLVYLGSPLDDEFKTLKDCNINDDAVIYLMLRLFVKKENNDSTKMTKKPKNKYLL